MDPNVNERSKQNTSLLLPYIITKLESRFKINKVSKLVSKPNNRESDNKLFNSKEISNDLNEENSQNLSKLIKPTTVLSLEYISR